MRFSPRACCSLALVVVGSKLSLSSAFVRPLSASRLPLRPVFSERASGVLASSFPSALGHNNNNEAIRFMMSTSTNNNEGSPAAAATVDIADNLKYVHDKITATCETSNRSVDDVRLVAVSKTKPLELLKEAYEASNRIFGENYIQELVEKAGQMPNDVEWHFIGSLQSNKANLLVKSVVPVSAKLTVETVSSLKVANKLNNAMEALEDVPKEKKLHIFIQVNTSGEDSKSGIEPSEVVALCKEITEQCNRLELQGLMTIGAPGDLGCFDTLSECRDQVVAELGMEKLELSMGMSGDFEAAIERGATNVRVGSTIFGARDYSNK